MIEIIEKFGVDWKILIAQAINFAIVLAVLTKFVYKPVLRALQKRREDIEHGIRSVKDAENKLKDADNLKLRTEKEAKEEALRIISKAEADAVVKADDVLKQAALKRDAVVGQAKVIIDEEKSKMLRDVYSGAEDLVRSGIEKVLGRMPTGERSGELIKEALKEVKKNYI